MDLTLWDRQIEVLQANYDVIALDMPGHGLSQRLSGEPSFSGFARCVAQFIESLDSGPVHLVGISFGSMVAQTVAIEHPNSVRSLTLIGTAGKFSPEVQNALRGRADFVRTKGMEAIAPLSLERWLTPAYAVRRPDMVDRINKILYQQEAAYHADLWDIIASLDTLSRLRKLTLAALVIVGEEDTSTPISDANLVAQALNTTNIHIVPQSSHFTNVETPAAVNKLMLDFFDSLA